MTKMTIDFEQDITAENAEQVVAIALKKYRQKHMMDEYFFWAGILPKLKQRWLAEAKYK